MAGKQTINEKKKDWSFIKDKVDNSNLKLDYEEKGYGYQVFVIEGNTKFFVNLYDPSHRKVLGAPATNNTDYSDFVDNYKDIPDTTPPTYPAEVDLYGVGKMGKKVQIHESSRPDTDTKTFHTTWTGAGDDVTNHVWGGGSNIGVLEVTTNDTTVSSDFEFDPLFGDVYIHEGYFMLEGAGIGDYATVSIVSKATSLQTSTNLDYEMDGNKVKFASGGAGNGTHGFAASPVLVPKPSFDGYWNYDSENGLSYAASQDGAYDIYDIEMVVSQPINKIPVNSNATSYVMFQSADSDLVPPGYVIRVTAHNTSGTDWTFWFFMTVYRETMEPVPA